MIHVKTLLKKLPFVRYCVNAMHRRRQYYRDERAKDKFALDLWNDAQAGRLLDDLAADERLIWQKRIRDVVEDDFNERIIRHAEAGRIIGRHFVMHNGLRIDPLSYYSKPILQLLVDNRAVHEPEEEYFFSQIIGSLPKSAVMLELGCYWAFYSMWFMQIVSNGTCFLVEPDSGYMRCGVGNFFINGLSGDFHRAYVSNSPGTHSDGTDVIAVDSYMALKGLEYIDILHSDIQGAELEMLRGATLAFSEARVSYAFISTHSNDLHDQCEGWLRSKGYAIIRSTNLTNTSSYDGLIIACAPKLAQNSDLVDRLMSIPESCRKTTNCQANESRS
jgi:hypothetical protein